MKMIVSLLDYQYFLNIRFSQSIEHNNYVKYYKRLDSNRLLKCLYGSYPIAFVFKFTQRTQNVLANTNSNRVYVNTTLVQLSLLMQLLLNYLLILSVQTVSYYFQFLEIKKI